LSTASKGEKWGVKGHSPRDGLSALREWWWGGADGDFSLYDQDGNTVARIIRLDDGRWQLRSPPVKGDWDWNNPKPHDPQIWATQEEAEHRAESIALANLPLDPKIAARIGRENSTPHPMGRPLNRPAASVDDRPLTGDPWSTFSLEIPDFLRR